MTKAIENSDKLYKKVKNLEQGESKKAKTFTNIM